VTDDQLASPLEQVEQGDFAAGAFEDILLLHLDHRKPAAIGVQSIALPRELLLPDQQLLSCPQPFLA